MPTPTLPATPHTPETVFLIHHGAQDYLSVAAHFAKKYGNRVILIGNDQATAQICDQFYDDGQIDLPEFSAFEKNYVHLSSATKEFELLCFKRYFLLHAIARSEGLDHFWMIDSDLVLLNNLANLTSHPLIANSIAALSTPYQDGMTLASSPHCSYWTIQGLENFIQFLGQMYQGNTRKILEQKYAHHLANQIPGGICDMTALYLWQKDNRAILNLASVHLQGLPLFDNNINHDGNVQPHEFEMIKRVNLKKVSGTFPCFSVHNTLDHGLTPLTCLHFQGKAKAYMKHFMHNEAISYGVYAGEIVRLYIKRRINSLKRKLSFTSH